MPTDRGYDELLAVVEVDADLFAGTSHTGSGGRSFGGEVLGQAIMAAGATVQPGRSLHSAHAYFLLPGQLSEPIHYQVDRTRDGGSFSTRRVEAIQRDRVVFTMTSSFQAEVLGEPLIHQTPVMVAPSPEDVLTSDVRFAGDADNLQWFQWLGEQHPVELRFPEDPVRAAISRGEQAGNRQRMWVRARRSLPANPLVHSAAVADISDLLLLSTALGPHSTRVQDPHLSFATLDHGIWYHAPMRADAWFLYEMETLWTGQDRGLCRGWIFDLVGTLCATTLQEGLIRRTTPRRA